LLSLYLLGAPYIEYDSTRIALERRKALALLAYLALNGGNASRDTLATMFWSEYDAERARAGLRRALAALNETPIRAWIEADRNIVSLHMNDQFWVDALVFQQIAARGVDSQERASALTLYRDHFMSGFSLSDCAEFDTWQATQTQAFQDQYLSLLSHHIETLMADNRPETAIEHLHRWISLDPWSESAHQYLIQAYAANGQRGLALRQYDALVTLLRTELDTEPDEALQALIAEIRSNRASEPERSVSVTLQLPAAPALIIGRDGSLEHIRTWMAQSGSGALILQGWPGIGKSTLLAAIAHDPFIRERFPDGILWVSLGESPNLLAALKIWGRSLGADAAMHTITTPDEASRHLTALLQDRRILLLIDDIWDSSHAALFQVGGQTTQAILTTRLNAVAQSLAASPEAIFKLPLLTEAESLSLLRTLAPQVVDTYRDQALELVRDLEGLPLALQVAGRLLRSEMEMGWGIAELLEQMRSGKSLLDASAPTDQSVSGAAPPTVNVLLERSLSRLEEETRTRFALLGIFSPKPATFDLEAMSAVWDVDDPKPTARVLVSRGLLEPLGGGRFQMHALLVKFAQSMFDQ
jgi:DNA-binding SARP family transcriptional activator